MILRLWIATLAVEVPLLVILLRRDILPWFTVWMGVNFIASGIELLTRNVGEFYDPFWRACEIALMLLLIPVVAECLRDSNAIVIRRAILLGSPAAIIVHSLLRYPMQWPSSYLEATFDFISITQALLGLVLIQVCIRGIHYQRHATVLAIYMLANAACYYAASAFPKTIGRAEMAVELMAVLGWLWAAGKDGNVSPKHLRS